MTTYKNSNTPRGIACLPICEASAGNNDTFFGANRLRKSALILAGVLLLPFTSACAQISGVSEYPIPTISSLPTSLVNGPEGNLWFDESNAQKIGRISTSGVITEYYTTSSPVSIVIGPDGNLWFTEIAFPLPAIARITPDGVLTEFRLPNPFSYPFVITPGTDGTLWFTDFDTFQIGKITTEGSITEFPLPDGERAANIISGADGNLWFTVLGISKIGKITPSGVITEFPLPAIPDSILNGPDGNVWFGEISYSCAQVCASIDGKVGSISSAGGVSEFPIPSGKTPVTLANGSDGNVWFTEYDSVCQQTGDGQMCEAVSGSGRLAMVSPNGVVTEYASVTEDTLPTEFFKGPDGNLWFSETARQIGKITPDGHITQSPIPFVSSVEAMTTGPDGNVWFIDYAANEIDRLDDLFQNGFED